MTPDSTNSGSIVSLDLIELDEQLVITSTFEDGRIVIRNPSDGLVIVERRLRKGIQRATCATLNGQPTLFFLCGYELLAHDISADSTTSVGQLSRSATALTAGYAEEFFAVVTGDPYGKITIFAPGRSGDWESRSTDAHRGSVLSVTIGAVRGHPTVLSAADDGTISATRAKDGRHEALWAIDWLEDDTEGKVSCKWTPYPGLQRLYDVVDFVDDNHWTVPDEARERAIKIASARRVKIKSCTVTTLGKTCLVIVEGSVGLRSTIAFGTPPRNNSGTLVMLGFPSPGQGLMKAAKPVPGGVDLVFANDSMLDSHRLEIHANRRLSSVWTRRALVVVSFFTLYSIVLLPALPRWANTLVILTLVALGGLLMIKSQTLSPADAYSRGLFRLTIYRLTLRRLARIDLHGEVKNAELDGRGGLIIHTNRGIAAFDITQRG